MFNWEEIYVPKSSILIIEVVSCKWYYTEFDVSTGLTCVL